MFNDVKTRREFLEFIGRGSLAVGSLSVLPLVTACETATKKRSPEPFRSLTPLRADAFTLVEGLKYDIITRWDDPITSNLKFGTNNDYLAFFPLNAEADDGILWVNHEYLSPLLVSGREKGTNETKAQIDIEMKSVGGSLIRIKKTPEGKWSLVENDTFNRRLDANTEIPFAGGVSIEGKSVALGTMGGCAGGQTPWGTALSAEENFQLFFGETKYKDEIKTHKKSQYDWEKYYNRPPEHYGWIVEIEPLTGKAKKHTSIGRYAHECATVRPMADGRVAVYSGDDKEDECIYKMVGDQPNSLDTGTLYVADIDAGRWISLKYEDQPILQKHFKSQLDVLTRCREAAGLVGGSKLARPEDIEIDPIGGGVYITLTNNKKKDDYFGKILKIEEKNGDPASLEFKASVFKMGGKESGFACPDNMAFDRSGNLWITTDVAGESLGKDQYESFPANGLYYIPMSGAHAGRAFQVASAPIDAELTGPCFSPDGQTLFLSIQHPGENTKSLDAMTSHWPEGGNAKPRSAVVAVTGPLLKQLQSGPRVPPVFETPVLKIT